MYCIDEICNIIAVAAIRQRAVIKYLRLTEIITRQSKKMLKK